MTTAVRSKAEMPDRSWGGAMAAAAVILLAACGPRTGEVADRQPAPASEEGVELISPADSEALVTAFREGAEAFAAHEFGAAAEAYALAREINPGDEIAVYLEAAAASRAGDEERALAALRRLAELGSDLRPRRGSFAALEGSPGFEEALAAIERGARPCGAGEIAFALSERDLYPEGIAWDPVAGDFYLGSLYKAKVVRVRRGARGWESEDFVGTGEHGLWSVVGLRVDPERRLLWLASIAFPPYLGFREADRGKSALYAIDLESGELRHRFTPPEGGGAHLFNDLDVDDAGRVYITDTASGEVWLLDPEVGELEALLPAGTFQGANGIALSDDGRRLFVASFAEGISAIDLPTLEIERLRHPPGVSTQVPDGLYFHRGSLVAVLNAIGSGRVVRFVLDRDLGAIVRAEILECGPERLPLPTTGAPTPDGLYVIANSQFTAFDDEDRPLPHERLEEIVVRRVPLE